MLKYLRNIIFHLTNLKIQWITFLYSTYYGIGYNKTWKIIGRPYVIKPPFYYKNSKKCIDIGDGFIAISKFHKNSIGVFQPVLLNVSHPGSRIIIGNNVGISGSTIKAATLVKIGNNVLIGSGCLISDSDSHPIHPNERLDHSKTKSIPIIIEDDVFIGARTIILKGVTLGKGSVIGAGSVVSKSVPPYTIAAGNPAKIVKKLNEQGLD